MTAPDQPIPHIFISYSRRDSDFVVRLIADLQAASIDVWIDKQKLTPGTPDWEQALRDAIRGSMALLLIASPESRKSVYVKDELRIADMYRRPVYPVWATGEDYIDCVPIGMGGMQYINAKDERYAEALATIVATLRGVTPPQPPGTPPQPIPVPQGFPSVINGEGLKSEEGLPPEFVPRNPYKGLNAFTAADRCDFFGREKLVKALVKALDENPVGRLLAVVGASGSGKSSVVMAGVLPTLQTRDDGAVFIERIVPGDHPLENLAVALANRISGSSAPSILRDLNNPDEGARTLHLLARQLGTRVYLFVDQFEELFTLTADETERQRFIDLMVAAVEELRAPVTVILTLRADFYDRPLLYPALGDLIQRRSHAVLPLELDELRSAIEQPAMQSDVRLNFEGDLVGDLLFEVRGQAGALPLLQFTLDQLFQRRSGRTLTQAAYRDIGGVRGALAKHAQATYDALPSEDHRRLARALFLRLIEPGATEQDTTRRRASTSELTLPNAAETGILRATADAFIAARLLTTDQSAGATTIEVSHEALIREWERLRDWLHDAREDIRTQRAVSADTTEWIRRGRKPDDDSLYRGTVLEAAQAWTKRGVASADETAFLQTSADAEARRKAHDEKIARRVAYFRRATIGLTIIGSIVVALAVIAGYSAVTSLNVAATAGAEAQLQNANAQRAEAEGGTQVALGLESMQIAQQYAARVATEYVKGTVAAADITTLQADAATAQANATYDAALYNQILNDSQTQAYLAQQSQLTVTAAAPTLTQAAADVEYAEDVRSNALVVMYQAVDDAATARAEAADALKTLTPIPVTLAAADAKLSHATATLGYVQDQGTQVAAQATYFGIEQARIGTLAAGAVVIPPGTLTPELLLPTLTSVAQLRRWEPRVIIEDIDGVQIEMVEVPPGCFMMGSAAGGDEQPVNEQCFDQPFYLDRYEVTQAQFTALNGVMAGDFAFPGDNRPVENITWFEARDFCRERRHARLPTEREWEYAARGPDSLTYPWGNLFVPENAIYSRVELQGTADVVDAAGNPARPNGASWVGALDMIGNVFEWTSTRYDDLDVSQETFDYQGLFPYPYRADDGREADETIEQYQSRVPIFTLRVVRGGSWVVPVSFLRGAARLGEFANLDNNSYGFRCARY